MDLLWLHNVRNHNVVDLYRWHLYFIEFFLHHFFDVERLFVFSEFDLVEGTKFLESKVIPSGS